MAAISGKLAASPDGPRKGIDAMLAGTPSQLRRQRRRRAGTWRFALVLAAGVLFSMPAMLLAQGPESVADLAEGLQEAVVNISTTQTLKGSRGIPMPNGQRANWPETGRYFWRRRSPQPATAARWAGVSGPEQ